MQLSQLNNQQRSTLNEFREIVKDAELPDSSDLYLLRWLIARDFDLHKAEKMLRASLEWRKKYRVNSIQDFKSPEVLQKYFPAGFVGRDKFLHPLWVVRYGQSDMKGILCSAKKKDYLLHVINLVETNIRLTITNPTMYQFKLGDSLIQSTIIFDMEGFSMRHITYKPAMDTAVQLVQLYEANYPELLRKVFVINAPKVFEIAFSLLKPFLHERTKNKISIYSHEPNVWKTALLADINPEELPVAYGGTKTDPDGDPNCKSLVNMGGEVPKSYYLNVKKAIANEKILTVNSGSREHVEFQVKEANSIIRWEFFSEDSDVAFALYQKKESELIPLVPRDRVDCHISNEEGEIQCTSSGTYVAEFDNTFSYLRSKKIHYSITVEQAVDEDPEMNGTDL